MARIDLLIDKLADTMDPDNARVLVESVFADELGMLRDALIKIRAHTSYVQPPPLELLQGLLQSIERIADTALQKTGTERE